jgi:hypothetical protein
MIVHNVTDKHREWIGSWEAEPLEVRLLKPEDVGRVVIYRDHGRAEAGKLSSWNPQRVWARFSTGDTAAACDPNDLLLATHPLDGPPQP